MSAAGDEISFTVRTAGEFREAVPHIDQVSLLLDATQQQGESERGRRLRVGALVEALFERYSRDGKLTRDVLILVERERARGQRPGISIHTLRADGTPGKRLGRLVSPRREALGKALARTERSVKLQLGEGNRCPSCLRLVDEWWRMVCERCDCGWQEVGCSHCLSPLGLQCLDSRVREEQ